MVDDVGLWHPLRQRLRTRRAVLERVEREA